MAREFACLSCGKTVTTTHNKTRYCDHTCYRQAMKERRRVKSDKRVKCPLCGGIFPLRRVFKGRTGTCED